MTNEIKNAEEVKEALKDLPEVPGEDAKEVEHKDSLIFNNSVVEKSSPLPLVK